MREKKKRRHVGRIGAQEPTISNAYLAIDITNKDIDSVVVLLLFGTRKGDGHCWCESDLCFNHPKKKESETLA